jgi:hypothetical protein
LITNEKNIISQLPPCPCFPSLIDYGSTISVNYLVIPLYGPDLVLIDFGFSVTEAENGERAKVGFRGAFRHASIDAHRTDAVTHQGCDASALPPRRSPQDSRRISFFNFLNIPKFFACFRFFLSLLKFFFDKNCLKSFLNVCPWSISKAHSDSTQYITQSTIYQFSDHCFPTSTGLLSMNSLLFSAIFATPDTPLYIPPQNMGSTSRLS